MESKHGRVAIGAGAIHNPPRAKYSEETRNLIKVLMEESKLTMMQRKSIQEAVDRGEPLPPPIPKSKNNYNNKEKFAEPQVRVELRTVHYNFRVMFPCAWKKRSQETIARSGAYERDQYRRTAPLLNKEKQKRHLACMMAYGQDMPPTPHGPKILHRPIRKINKANEDVDACAELVKSIEERIEFINEMDDLGEGKKYRPIIHQEIAQKLRLLEKIDKQKFKEVENIVEQFKHERSTPKPFPLGELDQ